MLQFMIINMILRSFWLSDTAVEEPESIVKVKLELHFEHRDFTLTYTSIVNGVNCYHISPIYGYYNELEKLSNSGKNLIFLTFGWVLILHVQNLTHNTKLRNNFTPSSNS